MTAEEGRPIKVLVVDDSPSARQLLIHILSADPAIAVIGSAVNGEEACKAVPRQRPDVVTMDVHMPKMDGLEATRRIMATDPLPIVIVSASYEPTQMEKSFRALAAGAIAVASKPPGIAHPGHEKAARELIQTVKLMAEVKVVRRRYREAPPLPHVPPAAVRPETRVVAIGASTGGPPALLTILSRLPKDFPVPVLIVQHMTAGFTAGFAEWLGRASRFPVSLAVHDDIARPGHAYVAPDGLHLTVAPGDRIVLARGEPENGCRPSVSCLFRSVASAYGRYAAGVLLTGMGRDGADGLAMMKERGAVTFAQDRESSVIYGMPGEAVAREAARYVLPPAGIADLLLRLVHGDSRNAAPQRPDETGVVP